MHIFRRLKFTAKNLIHQGIKRMDWIFIILCITVSFIVVTFLAILQKDTADNTYTQPRFELEKNIQSFSIDDLDQIKKQLR